MSAEKWVIDKSTLEDIGDAIRTKEGSSDDIPVTELKPRILAIQTGEDTSDATASAGEVLSGETFYADGKKTGTMPNNGAVSKELSAGGSYSIPAGYHDGSGKVTAKDLSSQTSGTAGADDILSGKTAWVGGSQVTGEMPVNSPSNKELPWTITTMPQGDGDATIKIPVTAGYYEEGQYPSTALPMKFQSDITPGTSDITVSGGAYFPSSFKVKGDANLVAENIKSGTSIFGVTGSYAGSSGKQVYTGSCIPASMSKSVAINLSSYGAPSTATTWSFYMVITNSHYGDGDIWNSAYADYSNGVVTSVIRTSDGESHSVVNDVVSISDGDGYVTFAGPLVYALDGTVQYSGGKITVSHSSPKYFFTDKVYHWCLVIG